MGAIALIGLAAAWNGLHNPFAYDDIGFLSANPYFGDPWNILRAWTRDYYRLSIGMASFRPVGVMVWLADGVLFKGDPLGYRLGGLLFHLLNACLVYRIGKRLLLSDEAAGWAGLLFAVHPAHTEVLNCVVFNGDIFSTFFALLAFGSYLDLRRPRRGRWRAPALALWVGLALFAKESALMLLPALMLYEILRLAPDSREKIPRAGWAAIAAATAAYLAIRFGPMRNPQEAGKTYLGGTVLSNLFTISQLPARYARLLVLPYPLSIIHDVPILTRWTRPELWFGVLGLLVLAALLVELYRRSPRSFFFCAWILLGLLPAMNLIPFATPKTLFSERYAYLPSVGFCWLAAVGWERLKASRLKTSRAVAAALVLACGLEAHARNADWASDDALMAQAARVAPFMAGLMLGTEALANGKPAEAERLLAPALAAAPDDAEADFARNDLAVALEEQGKHQEARSLLEESLRKGNSSPRLLANLGTVYYGLGDDPTAARYLEQALVGEPNNAGMHFNLGRTYAKLNDRKRSEEQLRLAKRLDPAVSDIQFWMKMRH